MMSQQDQEVTCTGDVWCAHHTGDCPPAHTIDTALQFDGAANMMALAIADIEKAQTQLPAEAGLWDHVDLVRAARHLRIAARLVDAVADRISAAAVTK